MNQTATFQGGTRSHSSPARPLQAAQRLRNVVAMVLSGLGLFLIVMTLTPFPGGSQAEAATASTGNIINQVGYLGLGLIYTSSLLLLVDRRVLARAISPSWIIVFAIAFWSSQQSYDPAAAMRGVMLTLVAMTLVVGIVLLPASERDFVNAGANAMLLLLAINYAAVVLIPDIATHTAASSEPWHAGSWRGNLVHKNLAAPVFSVVTMFGIYCWRSGAPWRGFLIFALGAIFVLKTESKTTSGFLPLAILMVLAIRVTGRPKLMLLAHLMMTALIFCLTIGTVISPAFMDITRSLITDPTFTGRDEIWRMGLGDIPKHFWDGHGYFGYWLSPGVEGREANYEAAWDVRGIISGHNTYMDALLTFGVPGGSVVLLILMGKPLIDYLRAYRRPQNRPLADFFLMVVIFMTYTGMMETFLLNRADPMWLVFALGVFGLGIVARNSVRRTLQANTT